MTVWGRDLRTAERNALARAALILRGDPATLDVVSVNQLAERQEVRA